METKSPQRSMTTSIYAPRRTINPRAYIISKGVVLLIPLERICRDGEWSRQVSGRMTGTLANEVRQVLLTDINNSLERLCRSELDPESCHPLVTYASGQNTVRSESQGLWKADHAQPLSYRQESSVTSRRVLLWSERGSLSRYRNACRPGSDTSNDDNVAQKWRLPQR
jgi:hypothetical protein